MGTFIVILLLLILFWPWISKWLSGWIRKFMANRAEDAMRRMMGMPSRKEQKRRERERQRRAQRGEPDDERTRESFYGDTDAQGNSRHERTSAMMQSVAVDVEYTEFKEFTKETVADDASGKTRIRTEEQISDAEFVEIKGSRDK